MNATATLQYITYCAPHEMIQAPACRFYWEGVLVLTAAAALVMIIGLTWHAFFYWLKVRAALRAEEERQRIDHDAIRDLRWRGEDEDVLTEQERPLQ